MPTKNNQKGFATLAVLSLLFLTISLTAITVVTNNPVKNQITSILAKTKEEKKAASKEKTQAQQDADARIRREERAAARGERSPCDGAQCVAGDVLKNSKGTAGIANPSAQQIAEQKILDNYVSIAANGDKGVLDVLQKQRPDLYAEAQQQIAASNLGPPGEARAEALARADAAARAQTAAGSAAPQTPPKTTTTLNTITSSGAGPSQPNIAGTSGTANLSNIPTVKLNATGTVGSGPPSLIPQIANIITNPNENIIQKAQNIFNSAANALFPTNTDQNQTPNQLSTVGKVGSGPAQTGNTTKTSGQLQTTATVGTGQSGFAISVPPSIFNLLTNPTKTVATFFADQLPNIFGVKPAVNKATIQSTTPQGAQEVGASKFGAIINRQPTSLNPQSAPSAENIPINVSNLSIQGSGVGLCKGYCDGQRMYDLYQFYAAQNDAWFTSNGKFTPAKFAAMMVLGEALGSSVGGNSQVSQETITKITEAISNQLGAPASFRGKQYCFTADCQGGAGIINFVGAYSQSAWERYNNLLDYNQNQSAKTYKGLLDQQLADYFAKNGVTLDEVTSKIVVNKPSDILNSPTDWGCMGCDDPGLKGWIQTAIDNNAPTGTTRPDGVYYIGKDGEVVYTRNQAAYWCGVSGSRCQK